MLIDSPRFSHPSIRFAPPLVIEEEDLLKAIKLIEESLSEIDTVSAGGLPIRVTRGADHQRCTCLSTARQDSR